MKLIVERDDGTQQIFQDAIDAYLIVHQKIAQEMDGQIVFVTQTSSHSWGNLREIAKELHQSEIEIQEKMKEIKRAHSQ